MEFQTHDNGGRPFTVKARDGTMDIYHNNAIRQCAESPFYTINYKQLIIGEDACACLAVGLDDRIYYICNEIYSFIAPTAPITMVAQIGNNDVVYAYAIIGADYYLLTEHIIINADQIVDGNKYPDIYYFYYRNQATVKKRPMEIDIITMRDIRGNHRG